MTTSTSTTTSIPQELLADLNQKMESLTSALLAQDPKMPTHLAAIHSTLQQYPETVHLLKDEEIGTIIRASQEYTKIKVIEETVKKSAGRKKSGPVDLSEM